MKPTTKKTLKIFAGIIVGFTAILNQPYDDMKAPLVVLLALWVFAWYFSEG
ncbi:MAG: hypothetical protein ACI9LT_002424 [Pseudoalteromonas distincta]|jgi:predicted membrane protein